MRPEVTPGTYLFYDFVARNDLPRNACPSLHAAFGVFTAGCAWEVFRGLKRGRWLIGAIWLWTTAVLVSTLLIKQHVILDLIAGAVLGLLSLWFKSTRRFEFAMFESEADRSISAPSGIQARLVPDKQESPEKRSA